MKSLERVCRVPSKTEVGHFCLMCFLNKDPFCHRGKSQWLDCAFIAFNLSPPLPHPKTYSGTKAVISIDHMHRFILYGYITNSQSKQLPDGLIALLESAVPVSQRSSFRILFRPECFSGFNFTTAWVVWITAMINHKFVSFSTVPIYDLSYIHLQFDCVWRRQLTFSRLDLFFSLFYF